MSYTLTSLKNDYFFLFFNDKNEDINMRVYPVVCVALVTIVVTQTQFGHAGRSFLPVIRDRLDTDEDIGIVPGPVGSKRTPQMIYCPVSSKITSFLSRRPFEKLFFRPNEATEARRSRVSNK